MLGSLHDQGVNRVPTDKGWARTLRSCREVARRRPRVREAFEKTWKLVIETFREIEDIVTSNTEMAEKGVRAAK